MDWWMDGWVEMWKGERMDYTSFEFHESGDCPRIFIGACLDSDSRVLIRAKKKADVQDGVSRWSER
jgi:hypothetical protein